MSEDAIAILVMVAFVGLAFALVYSPWPKSKEYREQEAIADRHHQKALDAWRLDVAFHASHVAAIQSLQCEVIKAASEFYANRAILSAHKRNAEYQNRLAQSLISERKAIIASPLRHPVQIDNS